MLLTWVERSQILALRQTPILDHNEYCYRFWHHARQRQAAVNAASEAPRGRAGATVLSGRIPRRGALVTHISRVERGAHA